MKRTLLRKIKIKKEGSFDIITIAKELKKIGVTLTETKESIFNRDWSIISGKNNKKIKG